MILQSFSSAPQGISRAPIICKMLAFCEFWVQPKQSAGCGYMAPVLRAYAHKMNHDKQRKMLKKREKRA